MLRTAEHKRHICPISRKYAQRVVNPVHIYSQIILEAVNRDLYHKQKTRDGLVASGTKSAGDVQTSQNNSKKV